MHSQIFAARIKEPKYYMCGDAPPPGYRGPGDAHSLQEWVWRRADYRELFAEAPLTSVRFESTPFYLYLPDARRRIAEDLPNARFVVVVRDPVDRAYSNWMHLWADGLEPEADFVQACRQEEARINAGWAPFWHYHRLGRYGEQLQDLFARVERERVLVLRYRQLIDAPAQTLDAVCSFIGVEEGRLSSLPADNFRSFVPAGTRSAVLGSVIRSGAAVGSLIDPQVWRRASKPLVAALHAGSSKHLDDIDLLEDVLGESFDDWRSSVGRGSFAQRARSKG